MAKADPAGFRERALARLRGDAAAVVAPVVNPHKQALNKVRNDQRRKALTPWQWKKVQAHWGKVCVYCDKPAKVLHREHFIPVELGGTLEITNIVPACQRCNNRKKTLHPLEYMAGLGRLARYLEICNYLDGLRK